MSFLTTSSGGQNNLTRGNGIEPFPDPFCDYASLAMPETLDDALWWCEFIMLANGVYRSAMSRLVSYFITDIEIEDADRDTKTKYLDFLHNTLGILPNMRTIGLDYLTYGNSFLSLVVPFRRYLSCPGCGFEVPMKNMTRNAVYEFNWNWDFNASNPK